MSDAIAAADTAAGETTPAIDDSKASSLPVRKRKKEDDPSADATDAKVPKTDEGEGKSEEDLKPLKRGAISKAREIRLEQNRKAARESRRRKKNMIEELQRSVVFFSRANSSLKQQNDELTRALVQAQTQVANLESGQQAPAPAAEGGTEQSSQHAPAPVAQVDPQQASQAQAVAQQAMYESQGFPSAAARTAAQNMNTGNAPAPATGTAAPAAAPGTAVAPVAPGTTAQPPQAIPAMQTGATMQAMANFQQATAAAMASAMGSTPGQQQAYTDALNAMAMQQAVAAAGQQFPFLQFQGMPFPVAVGQPAAAPATATDANQMQPEQPQPAPAAEAQQG